MSWRMGNDQEKFAVFNMFKNSKKLNLTYLEQKIGTEYPTIRTVKDQERNVIYCSWSHGGKNYTCYNYEICCWQGCCAGEPIKTDVTWIRWPPFILLFVMMYIIARHCIRIKQRTDEEDNLNGICDFSPNNTQTQQSVAQDDSHQLDPQEFMDEVIRHYRTRINYTANSPFNAVHQKFDCPPSYDDALNMPKPEKEVVSVNIDELNPRTIETDTDLPIYEDAIHL